MSKRLLILMCSIFLVVPLLFMGCADDGDQGVPGATAPPAPPAPGPPGTDLTANPQPESCDVCHGQGQIRDVTAVHAVTWVPLVSNVRTTLQADNTPGDLL